MDSRIVPALLIAGIVLTGTAVGASVMGVDPVDAVTPDPTSSATPTPVVSPTPHDDPGTPVAKVTAFEQTGPLCAADPPRNLTVTGERSGGSLYVTVASNFTVSDAGKTLARPTLERTAEDEYVLNVTSKSTDGMAAQCTARIRYEATARLPADGDGVTLYVEHDGRIVDRIESRETGSGVESEAASGD